MNTSDLRMKQFFRLRIFPAILVLCICITPYVSAFTLSSVTVNPPGNQAAGTPITIRAVIDFPAGGTQTFPNASELQMSTDLASPYWVPVLVLDGKDTHMDIKAGEKFDLPGLYLSYPPSQSVQVVMTVTGNIPAYPSPKQNLLKIEEVDADKNAVSTAHIAMPEAPMMSLFSPTTPTKIPTTKKKFTPLATDTPASPAGTGLAIIAMAGAALLVMRRR
jgi:hypothetical protein